MHDTYNRQPEPPLEEIDAYYAALEAAEHDPHDPRALRCTPDTAACEADAAAAGELARGHARGRRLA